MNGRLATLLSRQEIYDCLLRFARGVDRLDRELFLSAFHPDAEIAAGPFVGDPEALADWAFALHRREQEATLHYLLNHACEIEGEQAHAETYYLFVGRLPGGDNWLAGGRYLDRFERRQGEWRIATRVNLVEFSSRVAGLPLPFADLPDLAENGLPARDRSDPSYARPLRNRRRRQIPEWES